MADRLKRLASIELAVFGYFARSLPDTNHLDPPAGARHFRAGSCPFYQHGQDAEALSMGRTSAGRRGRGTQKEAHDVTG